MTSPPEQGCVFCKIIRRELPSRIVYEDEHAIGALDINPSFGKGQCVVFPRKHVEQFYDLNNEDVAGWSMVVATVARKIKKAFEPDFVGTLSRGRGVPHAHMIIFCASATPQPEGGLEGVITVFKAEETLGHLPESALDEIAEKIRGS